MKSKSVKILIRETNVNYYAWSMIADGFLFEPILKKYLGKSATAGLQVIENEAGQYGFDIENWNDLGRRCVGRLETKKLSLQKLTKEHLALGSKIMNLCGHIERQNLNQTTNLQIKKWLQGIWKPYLQLNALGFILVVSDFEHNYLTSRLISILRMHDVSENDVQNILSTLISPAEETLFWAEQKALLDLAVRYKSITRIKQSADFAAHVQKYRWLNYGYQGPVWTEQDFMERLNRILTSDKSPAAQYREHIKYYKELSKKQAAMIKRLKLNAREKHLFNAARQFVFLKGYRVEVRHYFGFISDLIFAELSRRFHLHPKFFRFATRDETMRILDGKSVNKKAVISRISYLVELVENRKRSFFSKSKGPKVLKKLLIEDKIAAVDDVKGQAAFPGRVRGRVRIVYSTKDLEKVKHGDILVAFSTNPDFLPAMYRANAFVTDVGGITSHAAIVAREMKKPCLIGTKVATKVFKDGDFVEVDANKGVIRKAN